MNEKNNKSVAIMFTYDGMGVADVGLRHLMAKNYLTLLEREDRLPKAICFYTDGVKLVLEGSPVLEQLKLLEKKGVKMISCKTCLGYYESMDKVRVGEIGTMDDIINIQWNVDQVIKL
jgi:hypothetical protein